MHCQQTLACFFPQMRSLGGDHGADCAPTASASCKGALASKLICLSLSAGSITSGASLPAFNLVK